MRVQGEINNLRKRIKQAGGFLDLEEVIVVFEDGTRRSFTGAEAIAGCLEDGAVAVEGDGDMAALCRALLGGDDTEN